jgi:hypothetical protein
MDAREAFKKIETDDGRTYAKVRNMSPIIARSRRDTQAVYSGAAHSFVSLP